MTDQQPVEGTPATPAPATPAEGSQDANSTRTAEQVEAEYKARLSGKDKAHSAEVAELRRQLEAAQQTGTMKATEAGEASQSVEELRKQLAEAEKARQADRQQFEGTLRSTKYPYAAEALDPQVLATMDEAKLAGLNARLTPSRPGAGVDPSTPPRNTEVPKPTSEKTAAELRADLARLGPEYAASLRR